MFASGAESISGIRSKSARRLDARLRTIWQKTRSNRRTDPKRQPGEGRMSMRSLRIGLLAMSFAAVTLSAVAQVPPSPSEIAAYGGIHAAAQRGDVAEIQRLAKQSREVLE